MQSKHQLESVMSHVKNKKRILFLCTGNSCRSQMAEGWARYLKSDIIDPYSAGIEKHGINPHAVQVMREAGVNIGEQYSKLVDELPVKEFDVVITVCDNANEQCPFFLGKTKRLHVSFPDPPKMAISAKTEEEKLNCYRQVRDQIKIFIQSLPDVLDQ